MSRAGVLTILIALLSAGPLRAERVTVFAAVSMKDALGEIEKPYEAATGDDVEFSFGASGQLAAQVAEGAPADVFISAAEKQVTTLVDAKVADAASRAVIASNRLVLIVPADAVKPVAGLAELADARVKRVAIGQPRTVPAGEYASQALTKLNLLDAVRDRLVYGANVRQVLDYVRRGEVDAGIVYATDAMTEPKVKVVATADASLHDPIAYPAVLVRRDGRTSAAGRRFLDHLKSDAAQTILRQRGLAAAAPASTAPTTRPSAP
jgi:molybdate transport system substrate-binding protein